MAARRKKQTILVTGASGFLGLHLVRVLHAQKHKIRSMSRSISPRLDEFDVDQRQGSVTEFADCQAAMKGVDAVYHLAGSVSRADGVQGAMYAVHVQGTRNILQAAQEAGVTQILVASTSGIIGVSKNDRTLPNEDSPVPWSIISDWPYYESKAYAEKEIARFVADGLPVKIVRPSLLLGPGDHNGSSTGDIVKFLCGDVKAMMPGGMSCVDVRDVAELLPVVMDKGDVGVGYLLTGINCPLTEFTTALADISGVQAPALSLPHALTNKAGGLLARISQFKAFGGLKKQTFEMGCHYWYVDSSRAESDLGWAPRNWYATLRDTVADLQGSLPQ